MIKIVSMNIDDHHSARPNFLRRGPGLLDSLYNIWCRATEKITQIHDTFNNLTAQSKLPSYIPFIDENIVCIRRDKITRYIKPFYFRNVTMLPIPYISVAREGCISLKRDTLERHLKQAREIYKDPSLNIMQHVSANEFIRAFEFLDHVPSDTLIFAKPVEPQPPYKIEPEWERHNR